MNKNITKLPPYLFIEIDKKKKQLIDSGVEVINFGVGDPDLPPPEKLLNTLKFLLMQEKCHQYASNEGEEIFRSSVSSFYSKRFDVKADPGSEIINLLGTKEGIGHVIMGYVNPGDVVLVPDPGYPVYSNMTTLCGGVPVTMPLLEENNFFPDLTAIDSKTLEKTTIMFLNYPNNPCGVLAKEEDLKAAVDLASKYGFIICYDNAYSEIYYDDNLRPGSIFNIKGAREVAIEFNSFSKMFNMTGYRVGFAIGDPKLLQPLLKVKQNVDSGCFIPIQLASASLLSEELDFIEKMRTVYRSRIKVLTEGLSANGWNVSFPEATFYVWAKVPQGETSMSWSNFLLEKLGIVVTPGEGFGQSAKDYVRFSLTLPDEDVKKAIKKFEEYYTNF
ncbi:aminotransferase class I/II-fold pyridoxal phosphate-dependent enzyme [bacterium]|nr:aminotransferase class I/II-fold pyridoxal phosphate-dependent enzyme [bacterium]